MLAFNKNQLKWFSDPYMMAWVDAARLNVLHHVSAAVSERAREKIISVLNSRLPGYQRQAGNAANASRLRTPRLRPDRQITRKLRSDPQARRREFE